MSFENTENIIEENKQNLDPYFLRNQFWLPNKDDWDIKFSELIGEKSEKNQEQIRKAQEELENEKNNGPRGEEKKSQESIDRSFIQSLHNLGLKKEDLKDKRVLDLGCGDGAFVQELINKNITKKAFGIDLNIDNNLIKEEIKDHFFQEDFQKEFPIKDVDYVLSNGAVSLGISFEGESMNMDKIIENSISAIKENGEIRIGPIFEAREDSSLEGLKDEKKIWDKFLLRISQKYNLQFKLEPRDIFISGRDNDIALQSILIIKKNLEKAGE
jgi:SAM-dependent methyltransferase